jgi:hypothetical protein
VVNFVVKLPITSTLSLDSGVLMLRWSGGVPPYRVQMTTNLSAPLWEDVGAATSNTSVQLVPAADSTFYRVVGQ